MKRRAVWIGGAVAVALVVGVAISRNRLGVESQPSVPVGPATKSISSSVLEEQYGIHLTHVAVTAAGGMVDLRFTVVDPKKADPLLKVEAPPPRLIVDESGLTLSAPQKSAMRSVRNQKDAACFVLYPNVRGAIKPGTGVSVAFGDLRVEPLKAL